MYPQIYTAQYSGCFSLVVEIYLLRFVIVTLNVASALTAVWWGRRQNLFNDHKTCQTSLDPYSSPTSEVKRSVECEGLLLSFSHRSKFERGLIAFCEFRNQTPSANWPQVYGRFWNPLSSDILCNHSWLNLCNPHQVPDGTFPASVEVCSMLDGDTESIEQGSALPSTFKLTFLHRKFRHVLSPRHRLPISQWRMLTPYHLLTTIRVNC